MVDKRAIAAALTLGVFECAHAREGQGAVPQVVVTGSSIKRAAGSVDAPMTVLSREDIEATGSANLRQVLDTLSAFDTGAVRDDGNTNSFARGASGASMRGLGKGATLVLLNGRRVSNYALADAGKELFVNLDAIPADVIDRIEVLKDGASAIYGSDAMAGVINVITRSSYRGVGVSASVERPQNHRFGGQQTAAVVAGTGNLARDGYHVLANLELYQRRGYMLSETLGAYPGWHKQYVNPALGEASVLSYPGNLNETRVRPAVRQAVAGCPEERINSAGLCSSDLAGITPASDPAERLNLFSHGRLRLGADVRGFAEAAYSFTRTGYRSLPYATAAGSASSWFNGYRKRSEFVAKPLLAPGNPANPFPFPVGIDYRFMDNLAMWEAPSEARQYRVLAGIEGATRGGWEWEVAAGRVGASVRSRDHGAHRDFFTAAVASGEYRIGGPNSQALLDRMFPLIGTDATTSQDFVDAKITGELLPLAGGPLTFAAGADVRREAMSIRSTENVINADIIGRGPMLIEGERTMAALFMELNAPLSKKLEVNAALRADKTAHFDAHVSPKLGVRYVVTPSVLLRATLAGGFRAPNIPETLGQVGVTGFFNGTVDPKRCDTATRIRDILKTGTAADAIDAMVAYNSGCLTSVPAMISSNPRLAPETSRSLTLGVVMEPWKNVHFALDYFRIEREDEIAYRPVTFVLERESRPDYGARIVRNPISEADRRFAERANLLSPGANLGFGSGQIQSLLLNYENFGKTHTSGMDIDLSSRIDLGRRGVLSLNLMSTIAFKHMLWDIDAGAYRPNTIGLRGSPRYTNVFSAQWQQGAYSAGVRVHRTSRTELNFDETDAARWDEAGCRLNIKPADDLPCFVGASMRTDLNFAYTGYRNVRLTLNVRNALNTSAPVDLRGGHALRPRSVKLGLAYKF